MLELPWWLKISIKVVLSRIPIGYRSFAFFGIFKHGKMHDAEYATNVVLHHLQRSPTTVKGVEFVGLELGVGDSIASAIVARASGASVCYLVDTGFFASTNVQVYANVVSVLKEKGLRVDDIGDVESFDQVLSKYGGIYLVEGLQSLKSIPEGVVDFCWSHAVLEHVREHEFDATMAELYRIMRPGGFISHRVDLTDHLGGALNNRRISSKVWEANWMAHAGFYTNRISFPSMIRRFEAAGFLVNNLSVDRWDTLPTPRKKMASEFHDLLDEDLLVSGFDVLLMR